MGKYFLRPLQIRLGKLRSTRENGGVEESSWIFSCKYPRTESLNLERGSKSGEDVYKNYNSLYVLAEEGLQCPVENEEGEESGLKHKEMKFVVSKRFSGKVCEDLDLSSKSSSDSSRFFSSSDSNRSSDLPPGLASGLTSQRFFFSPGRSNSILEEAKDVRSEAEEDRGGEENSSSCVFGREKIDLPSCAEEFSEDLSVSMDNPASDREFRGDACCSEAEKSGRLIRSESVAVHLNSPNPYSDFLNSMQEMVEAHNLREWECLEEMLVCYLTLNHKRTHKFILAAFEDLVTGMNEDRTPLSDSVAFSANQAT